MCDALEKQYRKYYEQWQKKKSHVKLLSCRILFFVCFSYLTEQTYYISLPYTLINTFLSLQREPWLVLLYLPCSSCAPHGTQLSTYKHLTILIYYSHPFQDDEPNFTFLGSITCLLHHTPPRFPLLVLS